LLADRSIDYWFANAGTDFAPVVEALAKAQVLETKVPTAVTCPHENTAMHMAIGYFLVTGRPQAVMVHVNVGTANGLNGLLNAARGHVPMLFTAGRTPTNEDGLAGHRSLDIHWTQEMSVRRAVARIGQWDYELRNSQQLETVVTGFSIARANPWGRFTLLCRAKCCRSRWLNLPIRRRRASMPPRRLFPTATRRMKSRRCSPARKIH
jgi:acetolactate synthase-1/2/3 large subunit